ncbi:hypothetical protein KW791_02615 [Candidatus Parcubacteria bacterium]|nr:hypothetical protein [Candidatus Parcubacteria bacterium]
MLFEAHVTVQETDRQSEWEGFCKERDISPLLIKLSRGDHPLQLMLAYQFDQPLDRQNYYQVQKLEKEILAKKFTILRTKLECPLKDVVNLIPGMQTSPSRYMECHYKLDIKASQRDLISVLAQHFNLALSQNLLRTGNKERWFMTSRLYNASIQDAKRQFDKTAGLLRRNIQLVGSDQEFVIYDTNPSLDKGWIGR